MHVRKSRWSRVYESAEEELVALLHARNIAATRCEAEAGEEIGSRTYPTDTQLWCAEGQATCTLQGKTYSIQPGDILDVPAGATCQLQLTFGGCVWYESAYVKSIASV
jgi:quercetin dioxygenase-like cupin family protein